jgi:hypothetical protein
MGAVFSGSKWGLSAKAKTDSSSTSHIGTFAILYQHHDSL